MTKAKAVSEAEDFIDLCKKMGNDGIATKRLRKLLVHCEEQERTLKIEEGKVDYFHKKWQETQEKFLSSNVEGLTLESDNVEWVVNDIGELGVKIGNQLFFLYKGRSLNYEDYGEDIETDSTKKMWRPVYKREFGETVLVPSVGKYNKDRGGFEKDGTYKFGEGWKPIARV